ncbi:class I SAM-dependent methyltransferase [Pukyongiella litopenaei]|uniref:Class I SAM-dependent methyltransferase n=1 Tax=Pukyongiella litopenaei TaxID=2605946 RepID=A0A2S0MQQ3_9RHOB|nr:class I SAM-dependent methyltransferase [Pukyongiella litopenaei]AVO38166.1 class I SAM-dependent methyltransferase [Pukyongiella litopenaei]
MFQRPSDLRYYDFLSRIHEHMLFDWYLEIGCRKGRSFANVRGKTIAVDPYFAIDRNVVNHKPALHIFQQTSDDFFDSGFIEALGIEIGVTFLDGMHLIEYLLRDFANTEARSGKNGVVAIHDCCPFSHEMTAREMEPGSKAAWTGDVWKIIPILQRYRPDLELTVMGCKPTGLLLVSNLDPTNRVLSENYEQIADDWIELSLGDYGTDRFFGSFEYTSVESLIAEDFPMFRNIRLPHGLVTAPSFVS